MYMCVELVRKQKPRSTSLGKGLGSGAAAVDSLSADEQRREQAAEKEQLRWGKKRSVPEVCAFW